MNMDYVYQIIAGVIFVAFALAIVFFSERMGARGKAGAIPYILLALGLFSIGQACWFLGVGLFQ